MNKRIIIAGLIIILLGALVTGFFAVDLESAVCYSGTGDQCEGPCCIANVHTCVAGPCWAFVPPLE